MTFALSEFNNPFFEAVEVKNIDSVITYFKPNTKLINPHHPNAHMKGQDQPLKA